MGGTASMLTNNTDEVWTVATKYKVIGREAGKDKTWRILAGGEKVEHKTQKFPADIYFKHGKSNEDDTVSSSDLKSWNIRSGDWSLTEQSEGVIDLKWNGEVEGTYRYKTRRQLGEEKRREREQRMKTLAGGLRERAMAEREAGTNHRLQLEQERNERQQQAERKRESKNKERSEKFQELIAQRAESNASRNSEREKQEEAMKLELQKAQSSREQRFASLKEQNQEWTSNSRASVEEKRQAAKRAWEQTVTQFESMKQNFEQEIQSQRKQFQSEKRDQNEQLVKKQKSMQNAMMEQKQKRESEVEQGRRQMQEKLQQMQTEMQKVQDQMQEQQQKAEAIIPQRFAEIRQQREEKRKSSKIKKEFKKLGMQLNFEQAMAREKEAKKHFFPKSNKITSHFVHKGHKGLHAQESTHKGSASYGQTSLSDDLKSVKYDQKSGNGNQQSSDNEKLMLFDEDQHLVNEDLKSLNEIQQSLDENQISTHENQKTVHENQQSINEDELTANVDQETLDVDQETVNCVQKLVNEEQKSLLEDQQTVNEVKNQQVVDEDEQTFSEDQRPVSEDQQAVSEDQRPVSEDQQAVSEDQQTVSEDQQTVSEDQQAVSEDQQTVSEDQQTVSEDQQRVSKDQQTVSEDQQTISEDQRPVNESSSDVELKMSKFVNEILSYLGEFSINTSQASQIFPNAKLRNEALALAFGDSGENHLSFLRAETEDNSSENNLSSLHTDLCVLLVILCQCKSVISHQLPHNLQILHENGRQVLESLQQVLSSSSARQGNIKARKHIEVAVMADLALSYFTEQTDTTTKEAAAIADALDKCRERINHLLLMTKVMKQLEQSVGKESAAMVKKLALNLDWSIGDILHLIIALCRYPQKQDEVSKMLNLILSKNCPATIVGVDSEQSFSAANAIKRIKKSNDDEVSMEAILKQIRKEGAFDEARLERVLTVVRNVFKKLSQQRLEWLKNIIVPEYFQNKLLFKQKSNSKEEDTDIEQLLINLCRVVFYFKNYMPRVTQIFSVAVMLDAVQHNAKGQILQIFTGEGKSCIVAMTAVGFMMLGRKTVDVVAPSEILAKRDCDEWKRFYTLCKKSAACNIDSDDPTACYTSDVVYGTVSSFAGDILRQEFQFKNIRPQRTFDAVIIDEVDSLLLDQGVQMTYLAENAGELKLLDPIFPTIYQSLCGCNIFIGPRGSEVVAELPLSLVAFMNELSGNDSNSQILNDFLETYGVSCENSESELDTTNLNVGFQRAIEILEDAQEKINGFPSLQLFSEQSEAECGRIVPIQSRSSIQPSVDSIQLLVTHEGWCRILNMSLEEFKSNRRLAVLDKIDFGKDFSANQTSVTESTSADNRKPDARGSKLPMPQHLEQFITDMMDVWINSALTAATLKENQHYLLAGGDVIPVDYQHTGVVQQNMRWSDGLQQFLQIKHKLRMCPLGIETNFMSNISFFQQYRNNVFGVSGTLGEEHEMEFLKNSYDLRLNFVPPHKMRILKEVPGIIVESEAHHHRKIAEAVTNEQSRATLVICEDIMTANEIAEHLSNTLPEARIRKYIKNEDAQDDITVEPGDVIVATNLAGRGTDFKVSDAVAQNGGLHVLITFFPMNKRVEEQAFGRSGRKGQPGSGMLLLSRSALPADSYSDCETVDELKKKRREINKEQMEAHQQDDLMEVRFKENLFKKYMALLKKFRQEHSNSAELKFLTESLNFAWGMWLKITLAHAKHFIQTDRRLEEVEKMFQKTELEISKDYSHSIMQLLKFSEKNFKRNDLKGALKVFQRAISSNDKWAGLAYYGRVYVKIIDDQVDFDDLRKDLEAAEARVNETFVSQALWTSMYCGAIDNSNEKDKDEASDLSKQNEAKVKVWNAFQETIKKNLKVLDDLKRNEKEVTVMHVGILEFITDDNQFLSDEMKDMYLLGTARVFDVKEKPKFQWEALIVACIGVAEVVIGGILCWYGFVGIGIYLIEEGFSDIMSGVMGMMSGELSIKDWLKQKLIDIAISVVAFGIGKLLSKLKHTKNIKFTPKWIKSGREKAGKLLTQTLGQKAVNNISKVLQNSLVTTLIDFGLPCLQDKAVQKLLQKIGESVHREIKEYFQQNEANENGKVYRVAHQCAASLCVGKNPETDCMNYCDYSKVNDQEFELLIQLIVEQSKLSITSRNANFKKFTETLDKALVIDLSDCESRQATAVTTVIACMKALLALITTGKEIVELRKLPKDFVDQTETTLSTKAIKQRVTINLSDIEEANTEKITPLAQNYKDLLITEITDLANLKINETLEANIGRIIQTAVDTTKTQLRKVGKSVQKQNKAHIPKQNKETPSLFNNTKVLLTNDGLAVRNDSKKQSITLFKSNGSIGIKAQQDKYSFKAEF